MIALKDICVAVDAGEVTCVLGDNGAGKSSFIKILSGVHAHDEGELLVEGEERHFKSPREARELGIATVFQDLATVPLMSVWRNFFLGSEPTVGKGPLRRIDVKFAQNTMREEMRKMGIDVRDPDQPVGTLSGGERQAVSIARAVYFGAKVLILDEPTSALGVKQSGVVLRYIVQARERGLGVIFITHNPHHAYPVGDRFVILNRGRLRRRLAARRDHPRRAGEEHVGRRRARPAHARAGAPAGGHVSEAVQPHRTTVPGAAARQRIGVGVIGFGWLGRAHTRSLARIPMLFADRAYDPQLVVCADPAPGVAEEAVAAFGFERGTDDWRWVIDDPGVDAVWIAAPNMLHVELVEAAAEAGKHVFCEKPVGGTPEQTVRAERAVRRAGVVGGVGFNYRWAPLVRYTAELIAAGELGALTNYRGRFFSMYGADPARACSRGASASTRAATA